MIQIQANDVYLVLLRFVDALEHCMLMYPDASEAMQRRFYNICASMRVCLFLMNHPLIDPAEMEFVV